MKYAAILLILATLATGLIGCEKPQAEEQPSPYDKSIDGVIALPPPPSGQSIVKGTGLPYASPGGAVPVPATVGAPAGGAVDEVKTVLRSIAEGMAAGQVDMLMAHLPPEHARMLQPVLASAARAAQAQQQTERIIAAKLGEAFLLRLRGAGLADAGPLSNMGALSAADVDSLAYESTSADEVVVRHSNMPQARPLNFQRIDGQWMIVLAELNDPGARQAMDPNGPMVALVGKLADAQVEMFMAVGQGVEDGSITAENFDERLQVIAQEKMGPVMAEMMAAMMQSGVQAETPALEAPSTTTTPPDGGETSEPEMQPEAPTLFQP